VANAGDLTMRKRKTLVAFLAQAAVLVAAGGLLAAPAAQPANGDVADLSATIADSPDPVTVGSDLTYSIGVRNLGPHEGTAVIVTTALPSHSDYISASVPGGSCKHQGNRVTCEVGKLPAAGSATVSIVVRPAKPGTISASASVDSVETDPVAANDKADATTTVLAPPRKSSCRGFPSTVTGTRGADRLVGTAGPDVIAGLGGGDVILGLCGRDLICSGGGNDRVYGGSAADRVFGGGGADRLLGRGGPDLLAGNPGRDVLKGNAGADRLRGGSGFDRCLGGAGRDIARGCER
jgi:uncharacterized repeat protein (TIGR01451 family)